MPKAITVPTYSELLQEKLAKMAKEERSKREKKHNYFTSRTRRGVNSQKAGHKKRRKLDVSKGSETCDGRKHITGDRNVWK